MNHSTPDWMVEVSLWIFAIAIVIMGLMTLSKRLQGRSRKTGEGAKAKRSRRKTPRR